MAKRTEWNPVLDEAWGSRKTPPGATPRAAQPWDAVFDQVRVGRRPDRVYARSAPGAEFDELEARIGSPLPRSYREFMTRFGEGTLNWRVNLQPVAHVFSSTQDYRSYIARNLLEYPDPMTLIRLVYFASSEEGDTYAWDPANVTTDEPREYQFYSWPNMDATGPVAVSRSFWEFVQWVGDEYTRTGTGLTAGTVTFTPPHLREKVAPKQKDVKLWLAHNNRAARDLARAICNEGRTDAFPILADALQEAGCTNADLLDSCRTGDPDIDGVWVLQVLLGKA